MVQEEREEREMVELEDTRETMEAMDKVVGSEFHKVESSVQDTSKWIMLYDPSSRKVLLWKGTIVARLMHDAGLSDQETALS